MDKRGILRLNLKFGKFLDPLLLLCVMTIFALTIVSVINLSPKTYNQQKPNVLGVIDDTTPLALKPVYGKHQYIQEERLEQISATHFRYTTFVRNNMQKRVSKPILELNQNEDDSSLIVMLRYTNSTTPRISFVESNISYILKEDGMKYSQRISPNANQATMYLLIENETPVLFDQYIEIELFLEQ